MRRAVYLVREALTNVLTSRTTTMVAVATTAFTFACVGVFLLLYVNLKSMAASLERDIQVLVYLQDDLGSEAIAKVERDLKADRAVASVSYISKDQAMADFQKRNRKGPSLPPCRWMSRQMSFSDHLTLKLKMRAINTGMRLKK